ncbi:pH-response regulator protein palA/rim20 [Sparganum proliferum]
MRIADGLGTDVRSSIKHVKLYLDLLAELDNHLDVSEHGVAVNFEWHNCFDHTRLSVFFSSDFEHYCMVFCLAALYSEYAAGASEEEAITTYRHASDFFLYVRDNLPDVYRREGVTDLGVETLTAFSLIMQAQGEEISALKAVNEGAPPRETEEIARRACSLYRQAAQEVVGASPTQPFPEDWISRLTVKADLMEAQAEYYSALIAGDTQNYSDQVHHLQQTYILLQNCCIVDNERVSAACSWIISVMEEAQTHQRNRAVTRPNSVTSMKDFCDIDVSRIFDCLPCARRTHDPMHEVRSLRSATDQCLSDLSSYDFLAGLPCTIGTELSQAPKTLVKILREYGGVETLYTNVEQLDRWEGELTELLKKISADLGTLNNGTPDYKQLLAETDVKKMVFERACKRKECVNVTLSEFSEKIFQFCLPEEQVAAAIQGNADHQTLANDASQTCQLADNICAELFRILSQRRQIEDDLLSLKSACDGPCFADEPLAYEQTLSELSLRAKDSIELQEKQMSQMLEASQNASIQPACAEFSLADLVRLFDVLHKLARDLNDAKGILREFVDSSRALSFRVEEFICSIQNGLEPSPESLETEDAPKHVVKVVESGDEEYGEV